MKAPKTTCCADRPRCARCPIRLLADDRMPEGYSVRKRRLVTVAADGSTTKASKKDAARAGELVVSAAKAAKTAKKSRKQTKKAAKGGRRTSVTLAA